MQCDSKNILHSFYSSAYPGTQANSDEGHNADGLQIGEDSSFTCIVSSVHYSTYCEASEAILV